MHRSRCHSADFKTRKIQFGRTHASFALNSLEKYRKKIGCYVLNSWGSSNEARQRDCDKQNVSKSSDGKCAIFFVHGICPWSAGTQVQAQQRESQPNGSIHSTVMELATPKHLHMCMLCFELMKLVRKGLNRLLALAAMKR